jgi:hypothetical protein
MDFERTRWARYLAVIMLWGITSLHFRGLTCADYAEHPR